MDQNTSFVTCMNIRKAVVSLFLLSAPFIFNYTTTWIFPQLSHLRNKAVKVPPTIPHMVPALGSSYHFAFSGLNFVRDAM